MKQTPPVEKPPTEENADSLSQNGGSQVELDPESDKKVHRLDPDAKHGNLELLVIQINTKERIIEAVVREGTNLNLMNEKICVLGDFKSYPKKFKEIFLNYMKNQYKAALTVNKI